MRQIAFSDDRTISYEYDEEERIIRVEDSVDGITEYTYDALGQLLTEKVNGEVVNTMTYDNYGNILTKNDAEYTYGDENWKDLLTGFGGTPITYDAQGNPTGYLGHTLTWEKGRQLKSFDDNTYTYNANGIRTSKNVESGEHIYTLDGTKILQERWNYDEETKTYMDILVPLYDNEESVCGVIYNEEPYYFHKNLQGDVIAIVDKNGNTVARYTYDAWGACTIQSDSTGCCIASINPFRYRGYYYDIETDMYYLQSRYYDPNTGRFINADDATFIQATEKANLHNLFAYCVNDPINKTDEKGFASGKVVGYGLQIELNAGYLTFGVELVWYIVSSIRQGRAWYIPYVYFYGGGGLSRDLTSMISKITKNPALLFKPKKLTKASASISIFAIWGYSGKFTRPKDYTGWFTGVSATIWNVKAYTAWSGTCFVVGAGISTFGFAASAGQTFYFSYSTIFKGMSNVYSWVSKKAKTLKKK